MQFALRHGAAQVASHAEGIGRRPLAAKSKKETGMKKCRRRAEGKPSDSSSSFTRHAL